MTGDQAPRKLNPEALADRVATLEFILTVGGMQAIDQDWTDVLAHINALQAELDRVAMTLWAENGTEAAEHIVNNVGWRPPAQDDALNLVCDMAFNWVRDFGVGDEDASREVIDAAQRLRPHPTYEEWLNA